GGPLIPSHVAEVESMIADQPAADPEKISLAELQQKGLLEYVNLEEMYIKRVEEVFDLDAIRNSKLRLDYDAMFGAGQNVMKKLFPDITLLHCEDNPGFKGQAPEPIHKNLKEFSELIRRAGDIDCGLVTDGDADRIGLY